MGFLTALLPDRGETRARVGPSVHPSESVGWLETLLGGSLSAAGRRVNADSALTVSAVYAGLRLLGSSVGGVPLEILKREDGDRRTKMRTHRLWSLLNDAPNPFITAIEYRELITCWALLHGNAVSYLELTHGGAIEEIIPLEPSRIRFWLTPDRRELVYEYLRPNGGKSVWLPRDQVFHLRGPLGSPWLGLGLLQLARDAIGLGMVAEEHASRFYSNAAAPAGVLTTPKALKKETWERIRAQWNARHQGAENAFKTAILEDGVEWKATSLNLKDQQFLETRTFQVQEIARWIGVPPHLIGELTRSTNNNIEAQGIEFVAYALGPWCVRWEQRIRLDCLGTSERRAVYAKHNLDAFLRGQTRDRYGAYQIGRMGGWLSVNDIRAREDMDPIGPAGDVYMAPLNMVPADAFGDANASAADPGDGSDPKNPPTMDGGTRAGAPAPELRVTETLRSLGAALAPLYSDAVSAADRRADGERRSIEKRTAPTVTAEDEEGHRQFVVRKLQPILVAFSNGLATSLTLDAALAGPVAATVSAQIAHAASDEFRAGRPFAPRSAAVLDTALQQLGAWAIAALPADPSTPPESQS